jgi:hypothetical protein
MRKCLGFLLICFSTLTLSAQTFIEEFTSEPIPPSPWGAEGDTGNNTGTLWYANSQFEYRATAGSLTYPANDSMKRSLGTYFGSKDGDWSIEVQFGLTATMVGSDTSVLLLSISTSGHYLAVGNGRNAGGNQFLWENGGGPQLVGAPVGTSTGTLKITYTAIGTSMSVFANGTAIHTENVGSWFTGPEAAVFSLGATSYDTGGTSPAILSGGAYFDYFTADGLGLITGGGPPVPEPSTYAAIMGAAAFGVAAFRRRRKTNTAA